MKTRIPVKKMTVMALLCAMSIVLVYALRIPFPPAPFLEYDPADIPIIMGALMFGPVAGLVITLVVAVLQGLTVSAGGGLLGIVMHLVATGTMAIVIGLINKKATFSLRSYVAVICGGLAMTLIMIPFNLIVTPIFMGVPIEEVLNMIIPIIVPFNLIKAGVNVFFGIHIYCAIYYATKKFTIVLDKI